MLIKFHKKKKKKLIHIHYKKQVINFQKKSQEYITQSFNLFFETS